MYISVCGCGSLVTGGCLTMQRVLARLTYFGLMWALPSLRGLYSFPAEVVMRGHVGHGRTAVCRHEWTSRAGPRTTSETKIKTWQSLGFPEKNGQKCRSRPICQSPAWRSDGAGAKGAGGMHMHSRLNLLICLVSCASCCASSKSPAFGDQLLR